MNILIPDSWLRDFLGTEATPHDIKRCLSLSGPSVERIDETSGEPVYDIEVTTNRIDMYSVMGIAREAAVILPEFGIPAEFLPPVIPEPDDHLDALDITVKNDPNLCRRILAVRIAGITVSDSPEWLRKRLELVGQRPLNAPIDITNYVMWELGHPIHAFDYDRLTGKRIVVRTAKTGETFVTLDGKTHSSRGGEIVFDDGTGTIIDLPGIMGTKNTVVTSETRNVLLLIEDADPQRIRTASMGLSIRTQAAVINEKEPDPESAHPALRRAMALYQEITGGRVDSRILDLYPRPPSPVSVTLEHGRLEMYLGATIGSDRVTSILSRLGYRVSVQKHGKADGVSYEVYPPSWRIMDTAIPEDVIEEVARIYGYHTIVPRLPDTAPPPVRPEPILGYEEELKIRLRDWGYTEFVTYSMLSDEQMQRYGLDPKQSYRIANPLSSDWEFMRPSVWPGFLAALAANQVRSDTLAAFELSMAYRHQAGDLPDEKPTLIVALVSEATTQNWRTLKGIAEVLLELAGIPIPPETDDVRLDWYDQEMKLGLGRYGSLGVLRQDLSDAEKFHHRPVILELDIRAIVGDRVPRRPYVPPPKFPPSFEDLTVILPPGTNIGPVLSAIREADPLVADVKWTGSYHDARTFRITYQHRERNLTADDTRSARQNILSILDSRFGISLKS